MEDALILVYSMVMSYLRSDVSLKTINPRAYTTFCKAISGINNWSDNKSLALILQLSKGCFLNDTDNIVGNLFISFLAEKLDRLIQPKDMLIQSWSTVEPKLFNCVYENDNYKPEIASILAIRLLNYIIYYFSQNGAKEAVVQDRILDFINNERKLLSDDLMFHIIKTLIGKSLVKPLNLCLMLK